MLFAAKCNVSSVGKSPRRHQLKLQYFLSEHRATDCQPELWRAVTTTQMCHVLQSHRERQPLPPSHRCLRGASLLGLIWVTLTADLFSTRFSSFRATMTRLANRRLHNSSCWSKNHIHCSNYQEQVGVGEALRPPGCNTVVKIFGSLHLLEANNRKLFLSLFLFYDLFKSLFFTNNGND